MNIEKELKRLDYVASLGVLGAGVGFAGALLVAVYSFGRLLADADDTWSLRLLSLMFYLLFTWVAVVIRRAVGSLYEKVPR